MKSLSSQVRNGVIWIFAGRILDRLLAFIKIPILAYLLSPHDFGLMGIISAVMLYLDVLIRTGFDRALVQKKDYKEYLDTTWTFNSLKGFLQTILLLALINPIVAFYNEPMLKSLLLVTILILLIQNFRSINLITLERNLDLKRITFYETGSTIFSTIITIVAAYYMRNVWALVIGQIALSIYALVASYIYAPYRPHFNMNYKKIAELWSYGKYIVFSGIVIATLNQIDNLYVGKAVGIVALGYYAMAFNIGRLIPLELSDQLRRVFFPAYSIMQNNTSLLKRSFIKVHIFNVLIGGLISIGLFFLSEEFVSIFLAEKWRPMIPVLRIFSIWCFFQMMITSFAPLFMAVGRPKLWSNIQLCRLILLLVLIYPLTKFYGIIGTAYSVTISTAFFLPFCLYYSKIILLCAWSSLLKPIILFLLSGLFVSAIVVVWNSSISLSHIINFILLGSTITIAYLMSVLLIDIKMKIGIIPIIKQVVRTT